MSKSQRPVWLGEDHRKWDHVRIHIQLLRDDRLDAYDLAVYMGLAVHADVGTGGAHPSAATLAGYAGISERKVRGVVRHLADLRYITIEERGGASSLYQLLQPPPLHRVQPSDDRTPAPDAADPCTRARPTPAHGADEQEPENKNQEQEGRDRLFEDDGNPTDDPPDPFSAGFQECWDVYPKKERRGEALSAYRARIRAGVSPSTLLTCTRNYAAAMTGTDPRFIMYGATFYGPSERRDKYASDDEPQQEAV